VEKSGPIICATFIIFKQQPTVNCRPIGEKSPNRQKVAQTGHPEKEAEKGHMHAAQSLMSLGQKMRPSERK
jgi:hypothetical protein